MNFTPKMLEGFIPSENNTGVQDGNVYRQTMMALAVLQDDPEYELLSNLLLALDAESFIRLLQVFGGTTIKIPTVEDYQILSLTALYYHLIIVEGLDKRSIPASLQGDPVSAKVYRENKDKIITGAYRIDEVMKNKGIGEWWDTTK